MPSRFTLGSTIKKSNFNRVLLGLRLLRYKIEFTLTTYRLHIGPYHINKDVMYSFILFIYDIVSFGPFHANSSWRLKNNNQHMLFVWHFFTSLSCVVSKII